MKNDRIMSFADNIRIWLAQLLIYVEGTHDGDAVGAVHDTRRAMGIFARQLQSSFEAKNQFITGRVDAKLAKTSAGENGTAESFFLLALSSVLSPLVVRLHLLSTLLLLLYDSSGAARVSKSAADEERERESESQSAKKYFL